MSEKLGKIDSWLKSNLATVITSSLLLMISLALSNNYKQGVTLTKIENMESSINSVVDERKSLIDKVNDNTIDLAIIKVKMDLD